MEVCAVSWILLLEIERDFIIIIIIYKHKYTFLLVKMLLTMHISCSMMAPYRVQKLVPNLLLTAHAAGKLVIFDITLRRRGCS